MARCPNGSRRNKKGECVKTGASTPKSKTSSSRSNKTKSVKSRSPLGVAMPVHRIAMIMDGEKGFYRLLKLPPPHADYYNMMEKMLLQLRYHRDTKWTDLTSFSVAYDHSYPSSREKQN
jgi:hypothetical protein